MPKPSENRCNRTAVEFVALGLKIEKLLAGDVSRQLIRERLNISHATYTRALEAARIARGDAG